MGEFLPNISVVIPVLNRSRYLSALFASLQVAGSNFAGQSEVIIIDDSSPVEAEATREICAQFGVRYLRGVASVRQKRNLGIEQARYPIVLFIDSDCQATPDLFTQHAGVYSEYEPIVAGVVGVTEFVGEEGWMWEVVRRTQFLNAFSFARRMEFAPWTTCTNASFRRKVLNELGGFEVNFPFRLGADDTDLGLRLNQAGYRIKCNPEAEVFHTRETWNSFLSVLRRAYRWGRMDVHLYFRRHRHHLVVGLPKFGHIFFLLSLASVIKSVAEISLWPLALPMIWAGLTLILQSAATVLLTEESWRYFVHELLADLLGLAFEYGTLIEGILCREPAVLYKTVRRGPVLPGFEQREWVAQTWCMWLAIVVVLVIQGARG